MNGLCAKHAENQKGVAKKNRILNIETVSDRLLMTCTFSNRTISNKVVFRADSILEPLSNCHLKTRNARLPIKAFINSTIVINTALTVCPRPSEAMAATNKTYMNGLYELV